MGCSANREDVTRHWVAQWKAKGKTIEDLLEKYERI